MSATIEHLQRPVHTDPTGARRGERSAYPRDARRPSARHESALLRQFRRHSIGIGVVAITVALTLLMLVNPALGASDAKSVAARITGSTTLAPATLAPGRPDTHTVSLTNPSKGALRYTLKTRATGSARLARSVSVVVKRGVTRCADDGFNRSGTVIALGTLDHFRGTAGSFVLPGRATEKLCVQQRLPDDAGNSFQKLRVQARLQVEYTRARR